MFPAQDPLTPSFTKYALRYYEEGTRRHLCKRPDKVVFINITRFQGLVLLLSPVSLVRTGDAEVG